jgi:hypothetical protein
MEEGLHRSEPKSRTFDLHAPWKTKIEYGLITHTKGRDRKLPPPGDGIGKGELARKLEASAGELVQETGMNLPLPIFNAASFRRRSRWEGESWP